MTAETSSSAARACEWTPMKCPKCGYENAAGALICNLCSEVLRPAKPDAAPSAPPPEPLPAAAASAARADEDPSAPSRDSWFTLPRVGAGGLGIFLVLFGLKAAKDNIWDKIEQETKEAGSAAQCKSNLKALSIGFEMYAHEQQPEQVAMDPASAWADYLKTEEKKRIECPACGRPYRLVVRKSGGRFDGFVIVDPPGAHEKGAGGLYAITDRGEFQMLREEEVAGLADR